MTLATSASQFPGAVLPGQVVDLTFRHPEYKPIDQQVMIRFRSSLRQLVIVPMEPRVVRADESPDHPTSAVSNLRVRYTVNSSSEENIGSAVRTFQVENQGNIPCRHRDPCSPDGFWKATTGTVELDAGMGNQLRDARATCIAGPCPFTHINAGGFANGGRTLTVSALNWSDTATFLVQAEVFHTSNLSNVRESYPVVFGRTLNFTLPPPLKVSASKPTRRQQYGVSPSVPDLFLSWANCCGAVQPGFGPGHRLPV